ncbi:MAG: hypothetical protein Q8O90_12155, partial [Elusimicrobiota bacterium]|nr:hypothetical protein [Elusimicrobiota bacterium]
MRGIFWNKILFGTGRSEADPEALKALRELPSVLYGAGWYAPYVREYLGRVGVEVAACFVDDGFTSSAGTVSFDEVRR